MAKTILLTLNKDNQGGYFSSCPSCSWTSLSYPIKETPLNVGRTHQKKHEDFTNKITDVSEGSILSIYKDDAGWWSWFCQLCPAKGEGIGTAQAALTDVHEHTNKEHAVTSKPQAIVTSVSGTKAPGMFQGNCSHCGYTTIYYVYSSGAKADVEGHISKEHTPKPPNSFYTDQLPNGTWKAHCTWPDCGWISGTWGTAGGVEAAWTIHASTMHKKKAEQKKDFTPGDTHALHVTIKLEGFQFKSECVCGWSSGPVDDAGFAQQLVDQHAKTLNTENSDGVEIVAPVDIADTDTEGAPTPGKSHGLAYYQTVNVLTPHGSESKIKGYCKCGTMTKPCEDKQEVMMILDKHVATHKPEHGLQEIQQDNGFSVMCFCGWVSQTTLYQSTATSELAKHISKKALETAVTKVQVPPGKYAGHLVKKMDGDGVTCECGGHFKTMQYHDAHQVLAVDFAGKGSALHNFAHYENSEGSFSGTSTSIRAHCICDWKTAYYTNPTSAIQHLFQDHVIPTISINAPKKQIFPDSEAVDLLSEPVPAPAPVLHEAIGIYNSTYSNKMFTGYCKCGYTTGEFISKSHVEKHLKQHVEAANTNTHGLSTIKTSGQYSNYQGICYCGWKSPIYLNQGKAINAVTKHAKAKDTEAVQVMDALPVDLVPGKQSVAWHAYAAGALHYALKDLKIGNFNVEGGELLSDNTLLLELSGGSKLRLDIDWYLPGELPPGHPAEGPGDISLQPMPDTGPVDIPVTAETIAKAFDVPIEVLLTEPKKSVQEKAAELATANISLKTDISKFATKLGELAEQVKPVFEKVSEAAKQAGQQAQLFSEDWDAVEIPENLTHEEDPKPLTAKDTSYAQVYGGGQTWTPSQHSKGTAVDAEPPTAPVHSWQKTSEKFPWVYQVPLAQKQSLIQHMAGHGIEYQIKPLTPTWVEILTSEPLQAETVQQASTFSKSKPIPITGGGAQLISGSFGPPKPIEVPSGTKISGGPPATTFTPGYAQKPVKAEPPIAIEVLNTKTGEKTTHPLPFKTGQFITQEQLDAAAQKLIDTLTKEGGEASVNLVTNQVTVHGSGEYPQIQQIKKPISLEALFNGYNKSEINMAQLTKLKHKHDTGQALTLDEQLMLNKAAAELNFMQELKDAMKPEFG